MKRVFTILTLMCVVALQMSAQHITEQQALDRALQYLNGSSAAHIRRAPANRELKAVPVEASSIYAFNCEGGGFVIASGDERTLPVLGYSDSGSLDWEQMPENMRAWLKQYDDAVASLGNRTDFVDGVARGNEGMRRTQADRKPVETLIKTHWNQEAPYWDQTPLYAGPIDSWKGKRSYTGCAATAMAQILNYYQWPKAMPDGLPDYNAGEYDSDYNYPIDALPPVVFDWDNMLNDYKVWNPETKKDDDLGTERQRRAVATLMRYCGQASKMLYGPDGSGAFSDIYAKAYPDYFDYPAALLLKRRNYGIDEWEDIMYGELAAGRPIQYGGFNGDGGHSFVCDGYDGDGKFHINWGWGGKNDGYFSLSVLNPYVGTDASQASRYLGFCIEQGAIIYIDPTMEKRPAPESTLKPFPILYQHEGIYVEDGNKVMFSFYYGGEDAEEAVADYALGTQAEDGTWVPRIMGDPNDSIIYVRNIMTVEVDETAFQPGESLTLYPLLRFRHQEGAEWQLLPPLDTHVDIGRTDEGDFFITPYGVASMMECVSGTLSSGTGRLNKRSDVTVIIKNNTEYDYNDILQLIPIYYGHIDPDDITDETPWSWGDWFICGAYVKAGQEAEVTFSVIPQQGGYTEFELYTSRGTYIGSFALELKNDTLYNYDPYVINQSHFAREDGKWFYQVELCDREDVDMPYWIPAKNLCLMVHTFIEGEKYVDLTLLADLKEYLAALPEKGGEGDYKFTYKVPINISREGEYLMDSYLYGMPEGEDNAIISCRHEYLFEYGAPTDSPTAIDSVTATDISDDSDGAWYTLSGMKLQDKPTEKGMYVKDGKKVFIR